MLRSLDEPMGALAGVTQSVVDSSSSEVTRVAGPGQAGGSPSPGAGDHGGSLAGPRTTPGNATSGLASTPPRVGTRTLIGSPSSFGIKTPPPRTVAPPP